MAPLPHIKEITVENFKRFEKLTIGNIGEINLIVGDNNVGKSSVLEMLLVSKDWHQFSNYLLCVLYRYKNFFNLQKPFILEYFNKNNENNHIVRFLLNTKNGNSYDFKLTLKDGGKFEWEDSYNLVAMPSMAVNISDIFIEKYAVPFIPFQLGYNHQIADYYSENIQFDKTKKKKFIEDLKAIIPGIDNIEPSLAFVKGQAVIIIGQESKDINMPLGTFGDGAIKLFRILIEMQIHSGSRLMIDEIDTGIHYKRMKTVWKTLIRAAKANNVQLFATTHNAECIKYYKEALEEEGEEIKSESRIIRLAEMKDKQVKAYTYEFHEFAHAIENDNELR